MMLKRSSEGYQLAEQDSSSEESGGEEETLLDVTDQDPPQEEPEEGAGDATPSDVAFEMTSIHPTPPPDEEASSPSLHNDLEGTSEDVPMQDLAAHPVNSARETSSPTETSVDALLPSPTGEEPPPSYESLGLDGGASSSGRAEASSELDAARARDALQENVPPSPTDVGPPLELTVITEDDEDAHNAYRPEVTEDGEPTPPHEVTFTVVKGTWVKAIVMILVNTLIALFILLMALSVQKLDYFQMGFKMKRVSRYVYFMDDVFEAGRYLIGPSNVFKSYSSVAHSMDFPDVRIYTTDPLRISFHCHFHFFLKKTELGFLEDELDRYYLETIEKVSISAIKNSASMYSIDNFLEMRPEIERHIHRSLQTELQGTCCITKEQCRDFSSCHECYANATTDCIRGYHVEVPFFNLLFVELPEAVLSRKQTVLITALGGEEELFHQEAAVTRKTTEKMVQDLHNQADLVSANATAHADATRTKAKAEARAITNLANSAGLSMMYSNLSVVEQGHKASMHWLRALRYHPNLVTGVSFEEYMRLMESGGG